PAGAAVAVAAGPQLQSVLISRNPGGRRLALIEGQLLRPGERFGGAVVVRITQTEVILRRGRTLEKLKLFPPPQAGGASVGKP
ncbi:MAG: MSHA biogenesis protein MshK, partial [Burkholderiaceae bacterium]|nr:MSHA biogenesis protein MshK [Burkholderiaceae bacterium]